MSRTESEFILKGHGKWSLPGVPHKGWYCVATYDNFETSGVGELTICEMCESQAIRYVHVMEHRAYPDRLNCGCVCAGNMEMNLAKAQERDRAARNRTIRRSNFQRLKGWKVSQKGNPTILKDGYRATIYMKRNRYMAIASIGNRKEFGNNSGYATLSEAKMACFDCIERLQQSRFGRQFQ